MALIGTIRKNFWFVLLVIGLALAAFVFMDVTSGPMGGAGAQLDMGEINGTTINYNDFQRAEDALYSGAPDMLARRGVLWDYFVEKAIVDKEADNLGLSVSYEELMDLQFGSNLSPIIQQNFRDPQTGQVDVQRLQTFKSNIENNDDLDPRFVAFWGEQEKQVIKAQLQDKITALASKAVYTPNWMAQSNFKQSNQKAKLSYVKIPYDQIDGADIELTDGDYKSYMALNKNEFVNKEETRNAEYIVFNVNATADDSIALRQEMVNLTTQFRDPVNGDSTFAISHNGVMPTTYFAAADLPTDSLKRIVPGMSAGQVVGPFIENGNLVSVKVVDKQVVPDSVKARHILRSVTQTDQIGSAAARKTLDSLVTVLNSGGARFDSLAVKFSQDPTAGTNFGDLGYFAQGSMVPEFNSACFFGNSNKYQIVQTQFGIHLIEVLNKKYNNRDSKYRIAVINESIIPSQETQDIVYDDIAQLIGANPYLDALKEAIADRPDLTVESVNNLKANDITFADLGGGNTSRDMIRWMFGADADINSVSPEVHTFSDEVKYFNNKYVAVGLTGINPEGAQSVASVRDDITTAVMNHKKAENFISNYSTTGLNKLARQYGVSVDTVENVTFNSSTIPGFGDEPEVIGEALRAGEGNVTGALQGNSGIFVVRPITITQPGTASNIPSLRNLDMTSTRSRVGFNLLSAMKDKAKITDGRSKFY